MNLPISRRHYSGKRKTRLIHTSPEAPGSRQNEWPTEPMELETDGPAGDARGPEGELEAAQGPLPHQDGDRNASVDKRQCQPAEPMQVDRGCLPVADMLRVQETIRDHWPYGLVKKEADWIKRAMNDSAANLALDIVALFRPANKEANQDRKSLGQNLGEKDETKQQIEAANKAIANQARVISDVERERNDAREEVRTLKGRVGRRDRQIRSLNLDLKTKDGRWKEIIAQRDAGNKYLTQDLQRAYQEIKDVRQDLRSARQDIRGLMNSIKDFSTATRRLAGEAEWNDGQPLPSER